MQTDPIGYKDGMNMYAYVGNDPLNKNDPTGKFANFAIKFIADVALGAALNYAETGELNLGSAVTDAAVGIVNPAKTLQKAKRLANVMKRSKSSPCPLSCFVAGTEVLTKDGHKPIEEIGVGDLVWAKNIETGLSEWKPVTHTWVVEDKEIYEIGVTTLGGIYLTIEATESHPFYVLGKGWIDTTDLKLGDKLVDDSGKPISVDLLKKLARKDTAYNFTVADFHTYYVTKKNVLVHNCNLDTKSSPFGDKVKGSETEVKNAVSEAKVHEILGDSSAANCAKCKLQTSINSRRKEQDSFEQAGQSKQSDQYKSHEARIEFEQKQLDELNK